METIEGYRIEILYLRKKNSSAQIRDGRVTLRISSRLNSRDRTRHIDTLLAKVKKRLTAHCQTDELYPLNMTDGQMIRVLGERCMLHLEAAPKRKHPGLKIKGQAILLTVPALPVTLEENQVLLRQFRQLMSKKKSDWLFDFVAELNERTVKSRKLKRAGFREQLSRWGSCSRTGSINISSRLIFCPVHLLEYVCLHELCHLVQPDHSVEFWNLVDKFTPDAKQSRRELKQYL